VCERTGPHRWTTLDGAALAVLLLLAAVVQWWLLKAPVFGDQLDYFATAASLPDIDASHRHLRLGLLLPVWLLIRLFGYSEAAYYAVPFLSFLALGAGTYLVGRRLFGTGVASIATFLILFNPYVLWDSSHLLPDVLGTALLAFSLYVLLVGGERLERGYGRSGRGLLLLAGVLLGWSYLAREYTVILFPLVPIFFAIYRFRWREIAYVAAGAAAMLGVELAWGLAVYGDPLARLDILTSRGTTWAPGVTRAFVEMDPLRNLGQLPLLFAQRAGGWFFLVVTASAVIGGTIQSIRGRRRYLLLFVWVLVCYVFFTLVAFAPSIIERPFLRMHKFRYWLPILPPLFLLGTASLDAALRKSAVFVRPRWRVGVAWAVLAAVSLGAAYRGVGSIADSKSFLKNRTTRFEELRTFLRAHGYRWSAVWVDVGEGEALSLVIPIYLRDFWGRSIWDGTIRPINRGRSFVARDALDEGLLLIDSETLAWHGERASLPGYLRDPHQRFPVEFMSSDNSLSGYSVSGAEALDPFYRVDWSEWTVLPAGRSRLGETQTEVGDGEVVLNVGIGDRLYLIDPKGRRLGVPDEPEHIVQGRTVVGYLEVDADGADLSRRFRIGCFFYDEGDRRHKVWAAHSGLPAADQRLPFVCSPPSAEQPYRVRVAPYLVGPLEVDVGDVELFLR